MHAARAIASRDTTDPRCRTCAITTLIPLQGKIFIMKTAQTDRRMLNKHLPAPQSWRFPAHLTRNLQGIPPPVTPLGSKSQGELSPVVSARGSAETKGTAHFRYQHSSRQKNMRGWEGGEKKAWGLFQKLHQRLVPGQKVAFSLMKMAR